MRSPLTLGFIALAALCACEREAPVYSGTVCLDVVHHGLAVTEATVYHRAGGERGPGFTADMAAAYDQSAFTGLGSTVCFEELGLGRHHFAGQAFDRLLRDSVLGSLALDLTVRARQVDTLLQVSEEH